MDAAFTADPVEALAVAGDSLRARPVEHNLILSLLQQRIERPEAGRYGWASDGGRVAGFFLQSPVDFVATVSPMGRDAVEAIVAGLDGVDLPGVNGEAATSAMFAGAWTERRKIPAAPAEGLRLYSLAAFAAPPPVPGLLRPYRDDDFQTIVEWTAAFTIETGSPMPAGEDHEQAARRAVVSRRNWIWDSGGAPVCWVGAVAGAEHVSRIGPVYTPPDHRGRGYAAACTGAVTRILLDEGEHPILYTQLANPISNGIYRRLGFRPVSENVRYTFG